MATRADEVDRLTRESTHAPYEFLSRVNGVVPGYAGHRPGAKHINFRAGNGGVPRPSGAHCVKPGTWERNPVTLAPGQGEHLHKIVPGYATTAWSDLGIDWKAPEKPSTNHQYLAASGGVKQGYMGFVPHSRRQFGSSHKGGVDGTRPDLKAQRERLQHAASVPDAPTMGTLQLPGMVEDAAFARVGAVQTAPTQPVGGAILGYSGHRPKCVDQRSASPRAVVTPWRRHFRELSDKVGVGAQASPRRPSSARSTASKQRSASQSALRPVNRALGVNDWLVHQDRPPPPLPPDSLAYVRSVGGVAAGYQGFVPHSAAHCGSSHMGMHSSRGTTGYNVRRPHSAGSMPPQRGHVGKVVGPTMRVQADRTEMSGTAGAAVVGYSGHLPGAHCGFGISPYAATAEQVSA